MFAIPIISSILRRFLHDQAPHVQAASSNFARDAIALLRSLLGSLRPGVVLDLLASWLNAWCVASRFWAEHSCRFCGECGPDNIDCLWRCPALRTTIFPLLNLPVPDSAVDALALSGSSLDVSIRRALAVHLVRSAHNMLRASSRRASRLQLWQMFLVRFRKLARDSHRERAILLRVAPTASPPPLPVL